MSTALVVTGLCVALLTFLSSYLLVGARFARREESIGIDLQRIPALAWLRERTAPLYRETRAQARKTQARSQALKELPMMLDVVTLGLSSGMSFDASLELYCQRYDTLLATTFSEAMLSWRAGIQGRDQALSEVAERLDVTALRRFSSAVSQALAFGAPLAEALEQQAQAIRDEQRAEMEADIERVPVRMLIPLGTLIVPAMLLSILGPLLGSSISFG